ncbi:ATP-binding protein [Haliscomenobacter sp.]|uniref:ATP-binding protein n=1 Tax=Haliscomenobacter sp. TaxID=2717303 RepID=UPI003364B715
MKHLTLILLLWSSFTFAQKSEVFRIDSLPKEGIVLDKGWKWHAGDDAEWAKVGYDDAEWESIVLGQNLYALPQVPKNDTLIWFRLQFVKKPNLNQQLAMRIFQTGASEIYLDGQLIHQLGKVDKNPQVVKYHNPRLQLLSLPPLHDSIHTLAIRFASQPNLFPIVTAQGPSHFSVRLFTYEFASDDYDLKYQQSYTHFFYLVFGVVCILFILFLVFYFVSPKQKVNLYFSIALFFGLWSCVFDVLNEFSTERLFWYYTLTSICLHGHILVIFLCVCEIFDQKKDWKFWTFITAGVISLIAAIFLTMYIFVIISLIADLFIIRISLIAWKNKKQGAFIILLNFCTQLLVMTTMTFFLLGLINLPDVFRVTCNLISYLLTPISLAIYFAYTFGKTSQFLLLKLSEVQRLSTEKQTILAAQNETLERQVTTRTAELNQSLETLKATQAQLIEREKLASLGELTAGIAHEIQNPLNFVNNFAEVSTELIDEMTDELGKGNQSEVQAISQDLKQNLEKINYHGKRASSIVKNMLEHSRTNAGHKESTDINALIDECLRLSYHGMRGQFRNFQADYGLNLASHLPTTKVVKQDLGRVLLNLFNNAFYAVHERMKQMEGTQPHDYVPKVSASTSKLKNGIEIRIKDNGTGIPEALKNKIFQPFFTTKPTGEGTGLGLSLSYEIITKGHGGSLSIESTEGMGTTFIIELPFEPKI